MSTRLYTGWKPSPTPPHPFLWFCFLASPRLLKPSLPCLSCRSRSKRSFPLLLRWWDPRQWVDMTMQNWIWILFLLGGGERVASDIPGLWKMAPIFALFQEKSIHNFAEGCQIPFWLHPSFLLLENGIRFQGFKTDMGGGMSGPQQTRGVQRVSHGKAGAGVGRKKCGWDVWLAGRAAALGALWQHPAPNAIWACYGSASRLTICF